MNWQDSGKVTVSVSDAAGSLDRTTINRSAISLKVKKQTGQIITKNQNNLLNGHLVFVRLKQLEHFVENGVVAFLVE